MVNTANINKKANMASMDNRPTWTIWNKTNKYKIVNMANKVNLDIMASMDNKANMDNGQHGQCGQHG